MRCWPLQDGPSRSRDADSLASLVAFCLRLLASLHRGLPGSVHRALLCCVNAFEDQESSYFVAAVFRRRVQQRAAIGRADPGGPAVFASARPDRFICARLASEEGRRERRCAEMWPPRRENARWARAGFDFSVFTAVAQPFFMLICIFAYACIIAVGPPSSRLEGCGIVRPAPTRSSPIIPASTTPISIIPDTLMTELGWPRNGRAGAAAKPVPSSQAAPTRRATRQKEGDSHCPSTAGGATGWLAT
jgi:hypothetical protein